MNFLEFKNFNEFKTKMGMDGQDAIMFLLDEIEKREYKLACQKRGENDVL